MMAVLYDVQYPTDNGTCAAYATESACLNQASHFGSRDKCEWVAQQSVRGNNTSSYVAKCVYKPPVYSLGLFLAFSAIIFAASIPVQLFLYYICNCVILAPTESELIAQHRTSGKARATHHTFIELNQRDVTEALRQHKVFNRLINAPLDLSAARGALEAELRKNPKMKTKFMASRPVKTDNMTLAVLKQAILKHRKNIGDPIGLAKFDQEWKVVAKSEHDIKFRESHLMHFEKQLKARRKHVDVLLKMMADATKEAAGAILMREFYMDLLGNETTCSQILRHQFECDDLKSVKIVNWALKAVAIAFILTANLFFLYSCALYSATRGREWQALWLQNVTFSVLAIVFFYDLVTALVINFFIPQLMLRHARITDGAVKTFVNELCAKSLEVDSNVALAAVEQEPVFSATDFFFTSVVISCRAFYHIP